MPYQVVMARPAQVPCRIILIFLLACQAAASVSANGSNIEVQRALFAEVERELKAGRTGAFLALQAGMRSYPLYPYLQLRYYRLHIDRLSAAEVRKFLAKNNNTPVGERLRYEWLQFLARENRWESYIQFNAPLMMIRDKTLACHHATALLRTGRTEELKQVIPKLWLVNFSQPQECDAVFLWGLAKAVIDDDLIWHRLLLVGDSDAALRRYLGGHLSTQNRRWYRFLVEAGRHPEKTIRQLLALSPQSEYAWDVVAHAMRLLAADDVHRADKLWAELRRRYRQYNVMFPVQRSLGIQAAVQLVPDIALRWLSDIPAAYHNEASRIWRIRLALRILDWRAVAEGIHALTAEERNQARWQYWYARSLERMGKNDAAISIWNMLAKESGYYNYLGADLVGASYHLPARIISYAEKDLQDFLVVPAVSRMREFVMLNRVFDARREFLLVTKYFKREDFLLLAVLANQWQWHDGTIRAIAQGNLHGDTLLRFPIPYEGIVLREADRHPHISASVIYAVMRRESSFMDKAKSPAGALGLMQLMPPTARFMINELKLTGRSSHYIMRPDINVRLGSAYLARLYSQQEQHLPLVLASYNAGSASAKRWLQRAPTRHADIWVETIPFNETRRYLRAVLYYIVIYAHQLGEPHVSLEAMMTLP